mmetsp:Transcript_29360/g.46125  ORF Transcript_29360/g.46125 Transcript_29360/m.46125 type:complete len:144 (+) Transcript_29360:631-1062(+)
MSDIGPASLAVSLASSLNVSPARSTRSGNTSSATTPSSRRGVAVTDRFIPSRASSNFNFTLATGTGRHNPIRSSTHHHHHYLTHGDISNSANAAATGGDGGVPSGTNNNNTINNNNTNMDMMIDDWTSGIIWCNFGRWNTCYR